MHDAKNDRILVFDAVHNNVFPNCYAAVAGAESSSRERPI